MWFIHLLGSFFLCSAFPMSLYFSFNDVNIVAVILLLLPSVIDFALSEIICKKERKKREDKSALIRTPENERIVLDYLRNNNIMLDYASYIMAVEKMSLEMFEEFLERANNNNANINENTPESDLRQIIDQIRRESGLNLDDLSDDQIIDIFPQLKDMQLTEQLNNEQKLKHINIPEDYILTNIKGFNNIEIYSNVKSFLINPLKQPLTSLCPTNKPIIINRNTIISELHLYYLLTVIDTAIGE